MPRKNITSKRKAKPKPPPKWLCGLWEDSTLDVFSDHPAHATIMAQIFESLREVLKRPDGAQLVDHSLYDAQDVLFLYSDFSQAARELYRLFVEGTLLPSHDPRDLADMLRKHKGSKTK